MEADKTDERSYELLFGVLFHALPPLWAYLKNLLTPLFTLQVWSRFDY